MSDRVVLRRLLKSITEISNKPNEICLSRIKKLVEQVNISILEIRLPEVNSKRLHNIYAADIYESDNISCSVFGIQKSGDCIPLHDHNNCFGFIRVLRGSLKITSYSFMGDRKRERELIDSLKTIPENCTNDLRPVIYEGEQFATSENNTVISLDPVKGNVHEVRSLEPGTAFFDVLIPGYKTPCLFYKHASTKPLTKPATPTVGDICWLRLIDMPSDYETDSCPYRTLVSI